MEAEGVEKIIKLNIGGKRYETSKDTLLFFKGTVLEKMINGSIPILRVKDRIFIDRNGKIFEYILDYLRNPNEWSPPENKELVEKLSFTPLMV